MQKRRRKVPDVIRRALRLGIGMGVCNALGFYISSGIADKALQNNVLQGSKWASITCIVVSAPVIGRVALVSFERALGTICGGLMGYVLYVWADGVTLVTNEVFIVVCSAIVGFLSVLIGRWLHLDYSTKLWAMTFVLVVMAAEHSRDAAWVAITRISGIVFGVFLSLLLCVLIFPKSATHEAVDNMWHAFADLSALHALAWSGGRTEGPPEPGMDSPRRRKRDKNTAFFNIGLNQEAGLRMTDTERRQLECEKALMSMYNKLGTVEGYLQDAQSEVYCTTIRDRWCFVPGLMWFSSVSRWHLPAQDMMEVSTAMRKVARILWSLHAMFQEGFGEESSISVLDTHARMLEGYPPGLLAGLQASSHGAIEDLLTAFPSKQHVPSHNLHHFTQAYQVLVKVSDLNRRRVVNAAVQSVSSPPPTPFDSHSGDGGVHPKQSEMQSIPVKQQQHQPNGGGEHSPRICSSAIKFGALSEESVSPAQPLGEGKPLGLSCSYGDMLAADAQELDVRLLQEERRASAPGNRASHNGGAEEQPMGPFMFPPSAAGHFAEVRWSTLSFMMRQLTQELGILHNATAALLQKLPHTALANELHPDGSGNYTLLEESDVPACDRV